MKTPILFKGEPPAGPLPLFRPVLRQASRKGRKVMTRRIVKLPKSKHFEFRFDGAWKDGGPQSPFRAGEYLHLQFRCRADGEDGWKNETFDRLYCPHALPGQVRYMREPIERFGKHAIYSDTIHMVISRITGKELVWRWKTSRLTSMLMPAEAARWFAWIGDIRVERLQDITDADLKAEGIDELRDECSTLSDFDETMTDRQLFKVLWESINGPDSWAANPWVWVIPYEEIKS